MPNGFLAVLFGAFEALILGIPYASDKAKSADRSKADAQFRAHRVSDGKGGIVFDGAVAKVLKTEETFRTSNGRVLDYVLTVFAITPTNRYFLFKSTPFGRPFLKELSSERARLVLKDRFRSFSTGDA